MCMLLHNDWQKILKKEMEKPYFQHLIEFIEKEYEQETVYPPKQDIFNSLHDTAYAETKVVLLGQDPYHGPGQAHGLSFSVKPRVKIPPSLRNMYKELESDLGIQPANNGYLVKWAKQGVLMLNTVLTVREGEAYSHRGKGWEQFTDEIIKRLNEREEPVIFILWGKPAQEKMKLLNLEKHQVITSPHPSPLSARRGFFGSRPFSKVNAFLRAKGQKEIDWKIDDI
ncbi:uracil-DNA glycosylase [Bacillus mesophilum]|uniref:Uracil-DNA glycosylase n=1 Tax=Bacillus mesophilum TaxID=1071718 RepID=A0A7V7RL43_9BACI|nr:uracil-DNA glycosylase [Bacillus mesophilum]KAB2332453.1 uracil-DNA glycosylase [Bacillus mesophilum]